MKFYKLGLLRVALGVALAAAPEQPHSFLPAPTGPYAVGRASVQWSDDSRPDADSPDGHRQLVVWLWYPAAKGQQQLTAWKPGKWGELYWSQLIRAHPASAALGTRYPIQSIVSHSYADVPPDRGAFPLLLFTPGAGEVPLDYSSVIEDLASHGYFIAGIVPLHSGSCIYSDGRIVDRTSGQPSQSASAVADLTFALNQLERLPTGSPWKNRIDFTRTGAFGHSLGGGASFDLARADARVAAFDGGDCQALTKPVLYLHASYDRLLTFPAEVAARVRQYTREFLQTARPGYDLWIAGARHSFATDHLMLPYLPKTVETAGTIQPERAIAITRAFIRNFFDQHLKGSKTELTIAPSPSFPEVFTLEDSKR